MSEGERPGEEVEHAVFTSERVREIPERGMRLPRRVTV